MIDLPPSLHRHRPAPSKPLMAIVLAAATLLTGCDDNPPPPLAENQRQYCAILDKLARDIGDNSRAHDTNNALQREESDKIDIALFQYFNTTLHDFFATQRRFDKWSVKLDTSTSTGMRVDNDVVTITFTSTCDDTPLVTAVSKRDSGVIKLLTSAKTISYAVISGSLRQIGYRDSFSVWGWGKPIYIALLMSSMFSVNDDGTIGHEETAMHSSDPSIIRAVDAAAANEYTRDSEGMQDFETKNMQRAYDMIKK
jgi:hypothetical protein